MKKGSSGSVLGQILQNKVFWLSGALASSITVAMFSTAWSGPGPFSYPLDDTYIHMAMGKTIAHHGVWGATPDAPASASSSPLWTLLLSILFYLPTAEWPGVTLATPLVLNIFWQLALIGIFIYVLKDHVNPWLAAFLAWLPTGMFGTAAIGMEHVAHGVLQIAFTFLAAKACASNEPLRGAALLRLSLASMLAGLARYESLFVIAPSVLWLAVKKQRRAAFYVAISAALPLLLLGMWWVHSGGWMLPNSLLLKGAGNESTSNLLGRMTSLWAHIQENYRTRAAWSSLALIALHLAITWTRSSEWTRVFSRLTLSASFAHIALASFGWLYRYDAYLIANNLLAIAVLATDQKNRNAFVKWGILSLAVLVILPRTYNILIKTPMAMGDRRWEHLMPARFVKELPKETVIMVNDLGVFAYEDHATIIDMFGLGHNTPIHLRQSAHGYTRTEVGQFAKSVKADMAILLPCWSEIVSRIPNEWRPVGYWIGPRNVVFGDHIVTIYALNKSYESILSEKMKAFKPDSGTIFVPIADGVFSPSMECKRELGAGTGS